MKNNKLSLGLLTLDQREIAIKKIVDYFASERDEEIGVIAADDLLEMFLQNVGPDLFNRGIKEAKDLVEENLQSTLFNIELLSRQKDK